MHQSTVQVAPLTAADAGSHLSDELSAILTTLEARLLAARSNPALLLTVSVHLTSSVSVDDFYRAWAANPTFAETSPILSLARTSELLPDTRASVSVSATAALVDPEPTPVGVIATDKAAAAVGAYSQAIAAPDGTVYVSGCIGLTTGPDPVLAGPTVEQQTAQALSNLQAILGEAGCQPDDIVKTVILLDNMKDFATVNEQYKAFFDGGRVPARSCFAADALPKGALVEIEAIAKQKMQH